MSRSIPRTIQTAKTKRPSQAILKMAIFSQNSIIGMLPLERDETPLAAPCRRFQAFASANQDAALRASSAGAEDAQRRWTT